MACFAHSFGMRVIFGVSIFQNIQMGSNAFVFRFPLLHIALFPASTHVVAGVGGWCHYVLLTTVSMKRKQWKWSNRIFRISIRWWLTFVLLYCHSATRSIRLAAFVRQIRECGRWEKNPSPLLLPWWRGIANIMCVQCRKLVFFSLARASFHPALVTHWIMAAHCIRLIQNSLFRFCVFFCIIFRRSENSWNDIAQFNIRIVVE